MRFFFIPYRLQDYKINSTNSCKHSYDGNSDMIKLAIKISKCYTVLLISV